MATSERPVFPRGAISQQGQPKLQGYSIMNINRWHFELTTAQRRTFSAIAITFVILSDLNVRGSLCDNAPPVCGAVCQTSGPPEQLNDHYRGALSGAELSSTGQNVTNDVSKSVLKNKRVIRGRYRKRLNPHVRDNHDFSLWIDEQQVKLFSGFSMEIYIATDGRVLPYILDPNFENYLPIIPPEVSHVNFTWKSGENKKYYYQFDQLQTLSGEILNKPVVTIPDSGRVPKKPQVFSVLLPCTGNLSGIAQFTVGLLIAPRDGKPIPGTPLRLKLRKECLIKGPDPECDKKCSNGGWCNRERQCQCPDGYMGKDCRTALCYPQCMNGGSCISPGVCSCLVGYIGRHCEGGICKEKCLNGGKCVQKDQCQCLRGYYGLRCELSKCVIPCLNGGRCKGVNVCRCPAGYKGKHCEIMVTRSNGRPACHPHCRHGACVAANRCRCDEGWYGKVCQRRKKNKRRRNSSADGPPVRKLWV
nr:EOG090X05QS [Moina brachiata]